MDDDSISTADTTAPEAEQPDEKPTEDPRVTKANKEAATYRSRLREAEKELAQHRKDAEAKAEADKSEAERRAAAEARAQAAELRALKLEVAHEKGLTPAQAKRLDGATREELEADADEILTLFAPSAAEKPKKPKPDPSQGPRGGDEARGSVATGAALYAQRHTKTAT